jgi:hypothetical protein
MRAPARPSRRTARRRRTLVAVFAALVVVGSLSLTGTANAEDGGTSDADILGIWEVQSLSGANNNPFVPSAGQAGGRYLRLVNSVYGDGLSSMRSGPNARLISNRVFNDTNVNVFSARGVSQWGFVWGQFIDHVFGLRDENGETANIAFSSSDPLESFTNTLGVIPFVRSRAQPGTGPGTSTRRQQINTVSSFIEASNIYGDTDARLDWLREGTFGDGNPDTNGGGGRLLLSNNYLPRKDSRGNAATAPTVAVDGRLLSNPNRATVSGDVRSNENIALTATHTLFAREHNRIVAALPSSLSSYDKYQLARAIVGAEVQYITYTQFLPAMGVTLPAYQGYNPNFDPTLTNEFATVGYRAHSQIHGELEVETNVSRYSAATLAALEAQGIEVTVDGAEVAIAVPLNVAFFNPDLVQSIQLGPVLQGIGLEPEYANDEMIDNQLRSVLFRVPVSGNPECLDGPTLPQCFNGVVDLGAIDIQRGRDHGIPTYNALRNTYGLASKTSFRAITGEASEAFPADPLLTPGNEINDPNSIDIVQLFNGDGQPTTVENDDAVRVVKRTPLAARLRAIHGGNLATVDAFTGMVSEPRVAGSELGELQRAIWIDQFRALRDGDRFHYANDPLLPFIRNNFGIDYRVSLAQVISRNTDIPAGDLEANVFFAPTEEGVAAATTAGRALPSVSADMTVTASPYQRNGGTGANSLRAPGQPVPWLPARAAAVSASRRAVSRRDRRHSSP